MEKPVFYTAGQSDALHHAKNQLLQWGFQVLSMPDKQVTHLLLPVPSFEKEGVLKGGIPYSHVEEGLPSTVTIFGGHLPKFNRPTVDFLKDEYYLQENAQITAQCALELLQQQCVLSCATVLLIGWGRIGKRLLPLLQEQGADITMAVRQPHPQMEDRIKWVLLGHWQLSQYDIIINTAPTPLFCEDDARTDTFLMDLASVQGISGNRVLWARGLPNKYAPERSGVLIAKTALRYALGKESV